MYYLIDLEFDLFTPFWSTSRSESSTLVYLKLAHYRNDVPFMLQYVKPKARCVTSMMVPLPQRVVGPIQSAGTWLVSNHLPVCWDSWKDTFLKVRIMINRVLLIITIAIFLFIWQNYCKSKLYPCIIWRCRNITPPSSVFSTGWCYTNLHVELH